MGRRDCSQFSRELLSQSTFRVQTEYLDSVSYDLGCAYQPLSPRTLDRDVWKQLCHFGMFSLAGKIHKKDVMGKLDSAEPSPKQSFGPCLLIPSSAPHWLSLFLALFPHLGIILRPSWEESGYPVERCWPFLWLFVWHLPGVVLTQ